AGWDRGGAGERHVQVRDELLCRRCVAHRHRRREGAVLEEWQRLLHERGRAFVSGAGRHVAVQRQCGIVECNDRRREVTLTTEDTEAVFAEILRTQRFFFKKYKDPLCISSVSSVVKGSY